ncbi:hypothetical protein FE257_007357 [Aspergillus nanangensis]|uniref:Major facilitator superfamily (MFS) profile domain-containing protein n=1 Tax=Aspergillus nanangensis TaxID=2582783 RepID=A0AAD4CMX0_ASPNN|nr:hypothetical protein FE257_007357 [Aspergillus nanangensis]
MFFIKTKRKEETTANTEKENDKPPSLQDTTDEIVYPSPLRLALLLSAVFASLFVVSLDRLIISTAIPQITDEFHSVMDIGWYGSAYQITSCAFQLLWGRLYTSFSVKGVFLTSILLFEVGSAICGAAPNSATLILGRAIAGSGSGGIMVGTTVILVYAIPLHKRPLYSGLFGVIFGVSSVAGPLLGGVFTSEATWRWCFYINLPFGAVTVVLVTYLLQIPDRESTKLPLSKKILQLDFGGTIFLLPAIVCLTLALQWGGVTYLWSEGRIIALLVLTTLCSIAFILTQVFLPDTATLPPRIFRQRSVLAGFWASFCIGALLIYPCYMPIWFQAIKGASALESGIWLLPLILPMFIASIIGGALITRVGYYTPFMIGGNCLMAVGAGMLTTLQVDTPRPQWIGYQVLYAFGLGNILQVPNLAAQTVLELKDIPVGTALLAFIQQLGGAIFLSVGQNVLTNELANHLEGVPGFNRSMLTNTGATTLINELPGAMRGTVVSAYNESLCTVFQVGSYVYALVAGASLTLLGCETLRRVLQSSDEHQSPRWPTYTYQPLEQPDAIRLLVIEPGSADDPISIRLVPACLSDNPQFEAISYVWGNPAQTKPVFCSGGVIHITHNLHAALQHLRLPNAERVLWADAVCINQADVGEKNQQVPLMKDIYSRASAVLVWLGSGSREVERALDALEQLHLYFSRHLKHYDDETKHRVRLLLTADGTVDIPIARISHSQSEEIRQLDWRAITDLLSSAWFGRVWTLQEIVNAQEAVLVCGGRSTPFDRFARPIVELFVQYINTSRMAELGLGIEFPINAAWSVVEVCRLRALKASSLTNTTTLYQLIKSHNLRQCSDPRDKIYGFLGLATDLSAGDLPLVPEYGLPVESVYKDFALWCIAKTASLDIFSSLRDYHLYSNVENLPSWAPDWMDWGGRRDTQLLAASTYAGGRKSIPRFSLAPEDNNVLIVRGYVVDKIEQLAVSYYQMTIWDDYRHCNYIQRLKSGATGAAREEMISRFKSEGLPAHYLDRLLQADKMAQKYSLRDKSCTAVLRDIVWIENCKDVATKGTGQMSVDQYEAFWRTITGDRVNRDSPAPRGFKWTFRKHLQLLSDLRDGTRSLDYGMAPYQSGSLNRFPIHHHPGSSPRQKVLYDDEYERWDAVRETWARNRRRRLCATVNGRFGWAPETAQEGDLICIFHGAKVPHVLRPCGDGNYILLGEGYLHRMMYGEVLKMQDMKETEIRIC